MAFLLFFLILILVIIFIAFSLIGGILRAILSLFGISSNKRRNFSNRNSFEEDLKQGSHQSQEGARRMRKFKNAAEDTDYEVIEN